MKPLLIHLRPALTSTGILALVCCGIYPLCVTGIAQLAFADQANGSLVYDSAGNVRGSSLLGQNFTHEKYFHPRPSAAGTGGYEGTSSSGSNLGPTSQKLAQQITERIASYRVENSLADAQAVPADAVTASASGLDPHISPVNAVLQAQRVAKARGLSLAEVSSLISSHTQGRSLGFLGEPGVNVLNLNMALDKRGQ